MVENNIIPQTFEFLKIQNYIVLKTAATLNFIFLEKKKKNKRTNHG